MKTYIVSAGRAQQEDVDKIASQPAFRKATRNMKMVAAAAAKVLPPATEPLPLALVLGSSYGEIETTTDFLTTLADSGVARPFLFQSSLHNATTGFLTLQFKIQGPSFTVSDRYFSGERALETGRMLLQAGTSPLALVTAVDAVAGRLSDALQSVYPAGMQVTEGATAFLLANDEGLKILARQPLATLDDLEIHMTPEADFSSRAFYDSDALEIFAKALVGGSSLKLVKPDGTWSGIRWSWIPA